MYAPSAPRAEDSADERVVITPDMMWGCTVTDIEVSNEESTITLQPHELICSYTYEIRNVTNLKHMKQVCGAISSMSGSLFFGNERLGTECVTLPFEGASDGVSSIIGQFYTFGHCEENTQTHRMVFYVWMDDGTKYAYGTDQAEKLNVTSQIHNAPDKRHVHIVIDGLTLPQPIENGSGYQPSIEDWDVVEEDIIM